MNEKVVLLVIFFVGCLFSSPIVHSLELSPGECITLYNNTICAENVTCEIDEKEVCTTWLNSNVSSSYSNISEDLDLIKDSLSDYNSTVTESMNDTFSEILNFVVDYEENIDILGNYSRCLDEVSSKELTLKKSNEDLNDCYSEKKIINNRLTKELEESINNQYLYGFGGFIGGSLIFWVVTRKVIPRRKEIETRESKRGF